MIHQLEMMPEDAGRVSRDGAGMQGVGGSEAPALVFSRRPPPTLNPHRDRV